ncbi:peptide-methionine (S)-S-oxide reductase MsrA [bacterium]|nr:peptide-methionine (S)-S-oxide reductase MsrA [candidate division CSSED10-310 bacterium]
MDKAIFAAGCFWGVESVFRSVRGVLEVRVGYTGGHTINPSYQDVCTDTTGHAEAVEITFDPEQVSYMELLDIFWDNHDPTTSNRQGPDHGAQYRSAIFVHTPRQREAAEQSRTKAGERFDRPVVTEITDAGEFYPAEEYHQRYHLKKGSTPICAIPRRLRKQPG